MAFLLWKTLKCRILQREHAEFVLKGFDMTQVKQFFVARMSHSSTLCSRETDFWNPKAGTSTYLSSLTLPYMELSLRNSLAA